MTKLFIVTSSTGSTPQEKDSSARVLGVYTDPKVADAVKQVAWGVGASVTEVQVDVIDPELLSEMASRGIRMPTI